MAKSGTALLLVILVYLLSLIGNSAKDVKKHCCGLIPPQNCLKQDTVSTGRNGILHKVVLVSYMVSYTFTTLIHKIGHHQRKSEDKKLKVHVGNCVVSVGTTEKGAV
jgi:hypothetical protein